MLKWMVFSLGFVLLGLPLPAQESGINSDDARRVVKAEYDPIADTFVWVIEKGKYVDSNFVSAEPKVTMRFEYAFVTKTVTLDGQKLEEFLSKKESDELGDLVDRLEMFCAKKSAGWQMAGKPSGPNFLPLPLIPIPPKEKEKPAPPKPNKQNGGMLKASLQK